MLTQFVVSFCGLECLYVHRSDSGKKKKAVKGGTAPKAAPAPKPCAGEVLTFKSPAEFFAENQNIAGFDNVSVCDVHQSFSRMLLSQ